MTSIYYLPMRWILPILFLLAQCTTPVKEAPPAPEPAPPSVDRNKIRAAIGAHRKYLSYCYRKALTSENGAKLKGKVLVNFVVGPDGKATNPKMIPEKSTLKNKTLNKCLFAGITSWDFPVHPKGENLDISFPFQFSDLPPAGMQKKLDKFQNLRNN